MSKIALLPGGFKPPHEGHYNMAKWLSANTDADKTIIFVGPKERDGITQAMSLKLWELYTQNDPKLEVRSAGVSPVKDVYDFIEQEATKGSTVYLGMGEKDSS
jgi:nicotinic acid mononucleotide adenylyltransferase